MQGSFSKKYVIVLISCITLGAMMSFPALSYDIFNYIATAKVAFLYKENPYMVMPIDITGEPNLVFTRAANKVALYGPVWILLSFIPFVFGPTNVWMTIIGYKIMNCVAYLIMCWLIWKMTKNYTNVLFFACNPLVIIEVLISLHNDIYMMIFVVLALWASRTSSLLQTVESIVLFVLSVCIKGATVVLAPLLFLKKLKIETVWLISFWCMMGVFIIVAPIREELYPWYAVWAIVFAVLLPMKSTYALLRNEMIALSFGLELRHVPYMMMGYYEGYGPLARILLTILPAAVYTLIYVYHHKQNLTRFLYEKNSH